MSTATTHDEHHDHHDHGPEPGLLRWVFTTNHKDIGTLYLCFALLMFFVGGALAMGFSARSCPRSWASPTGRSRS
jgi:hypothetical protein